MTKAPNRRTAYSFDPLTGEYMGEVSAWLSPLDLELGQEVYMLPAHATYMQPNRPSFGNVPVWKDGQWILVPDHRGEIYYDTKTRERYVITQLGDIPTDTWTQHPPIDHESIWVNDNWEIPLEILKKRKIAKIRAIADSTLIQIKSDFSDSEVISWTKQEAGARALLEDLASKSEDAEFVRNLAAARGIPVEELVEKIKNRFTEYYETMANVIGNQQKKEDLVAQAATPEELLNI